MAARVPGRSVFETLRSTYREISQKKGQYHLSSDVFIEKIKKTVSIGAQELESFYAGHCATRFKELADFSSILTAAQQKYGAMSAEERKDQKAVEDKQQCLINYAALLGSFYRARVAAAQLNDVETFLAPSSRNNPSTTATGWDTLLKAAEGFSAEAEKVDRKSAEQSKAVVPGKTELWSIGGKSLQAFEERHGPATVLFLKLFVDCTKVPREGVVDPSEETRTAEMFLRKREVLCLDVFRQTQALYEKEQTCILKISSVLANLRDELVLFNTQLKKGQVDISNTRALEERVALYKDLTGYLTEEVCKIGVLAAQLKLIGKFLASTQPLEDVGPSFVAQAQFTEFKAVKEEKEKVAQQNAAQVLRWAEAAEQAYLAAMAELEGWNGSPTELKHALNRFLDCQQNGWKPLSTWGTGMASLKRLVSPTVTVGPAVYEKEFWDRKQALEAPASSEAL